MYLDTSVHWPRLAYLTLQIVFSVGLFTFLEGLCSTDTDEKCFIHIFVPFAGIVAFIEGVVFVGLIINEIDGFKKVKAWFKPNNVVEPLNEFDMAEIGAPEEPPPPEPEVWNSVIYICSLQIFVKGLCETLFYFVESYFHLFLWSRHWTAELSWVDCWWRCSPGESVGYSSCLCQHPCPLDQWKWKTEGESEINNRWSLLNYKMFHCS